MPMEESVILVDENDVAVGAAGKLEAHQLGQLHRAISVFIFNSAGEWLLQKRAEGKYHSGGLWTNACCSHPRAGEETAAAASRRLKEEMDLSCDLRFLFSFRYKAAVGNGLTEHELDHVFSGSSNSVPSPDPEEVSEWRYFSQQELRALLLTHPENFTAWFRLIFERVAAAT
jgi:isopentenyl-diphosphate delta-isomerase